MILRDRLIALPLFHVLGLFNDVTSGLIHMVILNCNLAVCVVCIWLVMQFLHFCVCVWMSWWCCFVCCGCQLACVVLMLMLPCTFDTVVWTFILLRCSYYHSYRFRFVIVFFLFYSCFSVITSNDWRLCLTCENVSLSYWRDHSKCIIFTPFFTKISSGDRHTDYCPGSAISVERFRFFKCWAFSCFQFLCMHVFNTFLTSDLP